MYVFWFLQEGEPITNYLLQNSDKYVPEGLKEKLASFGVDALLQMVRECFHKCHHCNKFIFDVPFAEIILSILSFRCAKK